MMTILVMSKMMIIFIMSKMMTANEEQAKTDLNDLLTRLSMDSNTQEGEFPPMMAGANRGSKVRPES